MLLGRSLGKGWLRQSRPGALSTAEGAKIVESQARSRPGLTHRSASTSTDSLRASETRPARSHPQVPLDGRRRSVLRQPHGTRSSKRKRKEQRTARFELVLPWRVEPGNPLDLTRYPSTVEQQEARRRHRRGVLSSWGLQTSQAPLRPARCDGISEGSGFAIAKRWTSGLRLGAGNAGDPHRRKRSDALESPPLDDDVAQQAHRYLELIHFRYVPNHEHPSQVLVSQRAALQEALITSLRRRRTRDAAGVVAAPARRSAEGCGRCGRCSGGADQRDPRSDWGASRTARASNA